MPTGLEAILLPYIIQGLGAIGIPIAAIAASATFIASAAAYLLLAGAAFLVASAFQPAKPEAPKPEDGKFNLKQSVPPLVYVLGRVKKAGDYAFLEERNGIAFHIMVHAAHKIAGFEQHWLHDEPVTIDGTGTTTSPAHFGNAVRIETRLGQAAETAYAQVVQDFPEIWTEQHRGDGLATVHMRVHSVASEDLQTVFPNHMPQHSAILNGHAELVDPRSETKVYSENLALHRYWHLTHPVGGKLTRDDMYDPNWGNAASVCAQFVTNRQGQPEPRYYGGMWFRANNDPVQVGRVMDQAAELVIYERADGRVGVHAGEFVEPDVRLTSNDIISLSYDPNKRRSTNVLAVRGRFTDPNKGFNTVDAAIYGDPYPSDDERTKTIENVAVQRHNHMARLQKIAYIRSRAPRVKVRAHYEPSRLVPYRRFIRVHMPPKLDEAVIEVTGRPTLSLRALTYEFEGIVIPGAALYLFNASVEEGVPGSNVVPIEREDIPVPEDFDVTIEADTVGGADAFYGLATWTPFDDDIFVYELEWQPTGGGAAQTARSAAGADTLRSGYIADDVEMRFRLRRWSSGTPSLWTDYVIRTP